jgi:hypothetical protein
MKRISLTSVFLIFIAIISFGQARPSGVDIEWGPSQKESKRSTISDIIGTDETGFYTIRWERKGLIGLSLSVTLEHYNQEMVRTKSVVLNKKGKNKSLKHEFVVYFHDELYMFSTVLDKKRKVKSFYVQSIDKFTLQFKNDRIQLAEIDFSGNSKRNSGSFNYRISRDSTKLLVFYNLPYEKDGNEKFGFHVYDKGFKQIWEKQVSLPYSDKLFLVQNYKVSDKGDVFLLGRIFKDVLKVKRKGKVNFKYQILSYRDNGEEFREYPIELKGFFITDMAFAINENDDIVCGGFYSSEGTFSIKGSYYMTIDGVTKEVLADSHKPFDIDFITLEMKRKDERKAKRRDAKGKNVELYEYDLKDIVLKEGGGAVLIGEQFYISVVTRTTTDANGNTITSRVYYYNYNDVIIINVSEFGEIEWAKKIDKSQLSVNDQGFFSSYALAVVEDKLYFMYNSAPTGSKRSVVYLVEIDGQGNQSKEELFSTKMEGILIRPPVCEQFTKNEMIIFGQRKKNFRFAKLIF